MTVAAHDPALGAMQPAGGSADSPAVEAQVAFDIVKRAMYAVPVLVVLAGLVWGADGAWSALIAIGIVLVNLVLSALGLAWAARISLSMIMAVALGGFVVRMALVGLVVWAVKDASFVDEIALGVTVLVTHLGLLAWETRYVSASLAYPGLKPQRKGA